MAADPHTDRSTAYNDRHVPEAGPSRLNGHSASSISVSGNPEAMNGNLRAVKMEGDDDSKPYIGANGLYSEAGEEKPTGPSDKASPRSNRQDMVKAEPDIASFLNFETEDDKKVKVEQDGPSRGDSREQSPDLKDEDEDEDEKASRRPGEPVSIAHLPVAEKEAMASFEELQFSSYQNKTIGSSAQAEDSYQCECRYDPDEDDIDAACGPHSGCINRLTQVECLASDCRCKGHCQNQRFQKRQYGPIEIVQTEKKGFGVRARKDINKDDFIYEYIGDIIGEKKFQQRMKAYFDEGVRHFYFMQLQKEEFIDATKRGGKGRFLNHSCAPNCYVAKWVVGRKLRMGIFAKRHIEANEELTFNYNVDRYGHDAQECYCGEPNCVGYIGGKTQTDIAGMDDLLLDALGITDAVEALQLKGNKKKKGKKLDEDFNPTLTPIPLDDVPKVSSAIRQSTNNRIILSKLLERVLLTEDLAVQRQIMRLHGFSMMSMVLNEMSADVQIIVAVLAILAKWPLITRNKLQSTNMEGTVQALAEREDATISEPAKQLLELWQALEIGYRIPKAIQDNMGSAEESRKRRLQVEADLFEHKRAKFEEDPTPDQRIPAFVRPEIVPQIASLVPLRPAPRPAPPDWCLIPSDSSVEDPLQEHMYMCLLTKLKINHYPTQAIIASEAEKYRKANTIDINDVIARARAEAEAKAAQEAANAAAVIAAEEAAKQAKRDAKEKQAKDKKEKKMMRLFSTVVVQTMSKYKKYLDADQFKKRAKEVCNIMVEKEKKSSGFAKETYDALAPEKEAKVKKYVKEFILKLLARKGITPSSSSSSSSSKHSKSKSKSSHPGDHRDHSKSQSSRTHQAADSATPQTPSGRSESVALADESVMDMEQSDDDLINSLVEDATGGSETPDSAKTPQNGMETMPMSNGKVYA